MCTILSLNVMKDDLLRPETDRAAFINQVIKDYQGNHDGMTIVTYGKHPSIFRTMDAQMGVNFLEAALEDKTLERVWVHMRAATTGSVGVDYCHGWSDGRGMVVLHNGVLYTGNARKHSVDSMQLVELLKQGYGPADIHDMLAALYETFANIFYIDTDTGEYWLSTQSQFGVHTDGQGNYSSKPIDVLGITRAVAGPLIHHHSASGVRIVPRAAVGESTGWSAESWTEEEVREYVKHWSKGSMD